MNSPYEPVEVRVVVSRYPCDEASTRGRGRVIDAVHFGCVDETQIWVDCLAAQTFPDCDPCDDEEQAIADCQAR